MTYVKHLVSKKKKRYIDDGFDLDLAYIKPNIVAMGFPSENLEGVYRNNFNDIVRFLEQKHKDHYKVYNLCSERSYDATKFMNRVSEFPFDDHNAPPFELMLPCCKDMDEWLEAERQNVAIVHCKAGKGRTGVMICAYLLYKNHFQFADDAMNHYAAARTSNSKGVTIPSQRRYITYFGYYMRKKLHYLPKTVLLNSITFVGIPTFQSQTCSPSFVVYQTNVTLFKSKIYEVKKNDQEFEMVLPKAIPICGDIKIDVFHKDYFKKERMFVFWFNTFFLEHGVTLNHPSGGGTRTLCKSKEQGEVRVYELHKYELDKANKDKKHSRFPENFKVKLNITVPVEKDDNIESIDGMVSIHDKTFFNELKGHQTVLSDTKKSASLPRETNNCHLNLPGGTSGNDVPPPSPNTKRLQQSRSSPLSPTTPMLTDALDRGVSRSLEYLRVEDEPLSDDDDDEEQGTFPITRV